MSPKKTAPKEARAWLQDIGRKGGKRGGRARMKALTKAERSALAKKAARARWGGRS